MCADRWRLSRKFELIKGCVRFKSFYFYFRYGSNVIIVKQCETTKITKQKWNKGIIKRNTCLSVLFYNI